jgi:hypothetical protein
MTYRWTEVERNETHIKYEFEDGKASMAARLDIDPAPTHQPAFPNELELGKRGFRCRRVGGPVWVVSGGDVLYSDAPFVPKDEPASHDFKVGDQVRVIKLKKGGDLLRLGEVYQVAEDSNNWDKGTTVSIVNPDYPERGRSWGHLWQFELVRPDQATTAPTPETTPVIDAEFMCVTCKAFYVPNDHSSGEQCGYCHTRHESIHARDSFDPKVPPARVLADRTPRRTALDKRFGPRPGIDDTGGGSGPSWEE